MSFVQNETILGDGSATEFTLDNEFKAGTLLILYNDRLFYEYRESTDSPTKVEFDFAPLSADTVKAQYMTISEPNRLNALRYISVRQVNSMSRVSSLVNSKDADIEKIIREVEHYIDVVCGFWRKYYDFNDASSTTTSQILTFPRTEDFLQDLDDDEYVGIPSHITRAALYGTENIFLAGEPTSTVSNQLKSEKLGDYSYTVANASDGLSAINSAKNILGNRSAAELKGFVKRIGRMDIVDENIGNVELLNSRQRFKLKH